MVRLNRTYYSLLKFTRKIFKNCLPQSNSSELRKFRAIHPHSLRIPQNSHYSVNLFYIMFQAPAPAENPAKFQRITQIPRNSPTQPVNHVKFAPFAKHYTLRFRCLTSGRELLKIPANQARFAQFAQLPRELREFRAFHS